MSHLQSRPNPTPLDPSLYALSNEEIEFYSNQTGITDPEELKKHIIDVQERAYKVFPYFCIRRFAFTSLKISRMPVYQYVLGLPKNYSDAILLDFACCFGNDARKAVADGFPANQVYASDLRKEFWDLGHELFKVEPETCPITFIHGDIFDPSFFPVLEPAYDSTSVSDAPLHHTPGQILTSLSFLSHRVTAIHVSSFFHLFGEEEQSVVAHRLGGILSPRPGSIIFGSHRGAEKKGSLNNVVVAGERFAHDPESWKELWDGNVFKKGTVEIQAELVSFSRDDPKKALGERGEKISVLMLVWSVKRI